MKRLLLCTLALSGATAIAQDTPAPNPKDLKARSAEMAPLAARSLLLAVAKTDGHFVVVGDRGVILVSADGEKWEQVPSPVQSTLTSVSFADEKNGWAGGHDASILHTADGGRTWALQNFQPDLNKPILSLLALDTQRALATGAYGLFLSTNDGGAHWKQIEAPALLGDGRHVNSLIKLGDGELFVAGETGLLGVSHDGSAWTRLKLPYQGSLFGALPRGDKGALVYGLRGNVFMSDDVHTNQWRKVDARTVLSFFGGTRLGNGDAVLVGADGEVVRITTAGVASNARIAKDERSLGSGTLSGVLARDGELLVVGELGIGRVKAATLAPTAAPTPPAPAASTEAPTPPPAPAASAKAPTPAPAPATSAPAPTRTVTAPTRAIVAPAPTAAAHPAGLHEGADFTLGKSLSLHGRPTDSATSVGTLHEGTVAKLKSRITNPTGTWWYVSGTGGSGWVTDAELKRAGS